MEKKPRGRPPKVVKEEEVIKKPRGRPPKVVKEEEVIKKPRGRPPKIVKEEEVIKKLRERLPKVVKEEEVIKKPRGRPLKVVKEEEVIKKPRGRLPKVVKEKVEDEDEKRIDNYKKIKFLIKDVGELKIDGKDIYIGNIKIIKKIGSESKNGLILMGEIENYKIAIKITKYNKNKTNELDTFKTVTREVIENKSNNFPLLYEYNIYEPIKNYEKFPIIFHKFIKNPFIIYFNELADGDLKQFLNDNYNNDDLIINALYQCLMSLIDFYRITGKIHNDSHSGNFLYHKISKKNKDFEYIYEDKKCEIRNLGYIFVIWDLEKSTEINKHKYRINTDIEKLLLEFFNENDKIRGFMSSKKQYGAKVKNIVMDLYMSLIIDNKTSFNKLGYSPEKLKELISIIYKKII
jgi:hypothetical protein